MITTRYPFSACHPIRESLRVLVAVIVVLGGFAGGLEAQREAGIVLFEEDFERGYRAGERLAGQEGWMDHAVKYPSAEVVLDPLLGMSLAPFQGDESRNIKVVDYPGRLDDELEVLVYEMSLITKGNSISSTANSFGLGPLADVPLQVGVNIQGVFMRIRFGDWNYLLTAKDGFELDTLGGETRLVVRINRRTGEIDCRAQAGGEDFKAVRITKFADELRSYFAENPLRDWERVFVRLGPNEHTRVGSMSLSVEEAGR